MTEQIKDRRTNKLAGAGEKREKTEGEFYYLDRQNLKVSICGQKRDLKFRLKLK